MSDNSNITLSGSQGIRHDASYSTQYTTVKKYELMDDLSPAQLARLRDVQYKWLRAKTKNNPDANIKDTDPLPEDDEENFYEHVFRAWDSTNAMNFLPTLPDRKFADTYFPVGKFTEDHPEPASKKRKRGADSPAEIPLHRRRGAPAYLNPTLSYGTDSISHQWKDGKGRFINWKYVELDAGLTLAMATAKANTTYDTFGTKRILTYNTDLAVAITRRHHSSPHRRVFKAQ